jgi:hypothetical protein
VKRNLYMGILLASAWACAASTALAAGEAGAAGTAGVTRTTDALPAPTDAATVPVHDRAFWESIEANDFAVPAGESAIDLAIELAGLSASPDRTLRDAIGYEITAAWVYRKRVFKPEELLRLVSLYEANLRRKLGETGTDSVLGRSFAALNLSTLAALDNESPFLGKREFDSLLDAAIGALAGERDLRGFDPKVGWVHSAAHAADLLKFLARNRLLDPPGQRRILDAIAAKMAARTGLVFDWGEDDRLARAVVSVIARKDFDEDGFDAWAARLPEVSKGLWDKPADIDAVQFAAVRNTRNLLGNVFVVLSQSDGLTPGQSRAKASVLKAIGTIGS